MDRQGKRLFGDTTFGVKKAALSLMSSRTLSTLADCSAGSAVLLNHGGQRPISAGCYPWCLATNSEEKLTPLTGKGR